VCGQEILCNSDKRFDKNVKHVTPPTVKMVLVDNDVLVSDQWCHESNLAKGAALIVNALCFVSLV
jgi:hypothetical protein